LETDDDADDDGQRKRVKEDVTGVSLATLLAGRDPGHNDALGIYHLAHELAGELLTATTM